MCNRYVSPQDYDIEHEFDVPKGRVPWAIREVFPRAKGPFIRQGKTGEREMVLGQWGLIPFFAKTATLPYSTNNARFEELASKPSYKGPWARRQRCIIPALSFDEPCWETGRNVWHRFTRADDRPWALAGLWNTWTDPLTGEMHESYTMLTINADEHPIMGRMHKPDPKLPANQQDKRSVVVLAHGDFDAWLQGTIAEAASRVRLAPVEIFKVWPEQPGTRFTPEPAEPVSLWRLESGDAQQGG